MTKCDTCKYHMIYQYSKEYKESMDNAHAYGYKEPLKKFQCTFSTKISTNYIIKCSRYERK